MKITPQQAHVLANLDRVLIIEPKLTTPSPRPRYQLDGRECTTQINGLMVRKLIGKHSGGGFRRLAEASERDKRIGERQPVPPNAIEAIRASLAQPETVRTIGASKRQASI